MSDQKSGKPQREGVIRMSPERVREEESKVLSMLQDKYNLPTEDLDAAIMVEVELSDPSTDITNLVEAMDFYNSKGLTPNQIMFLAINANSRKNALSMQVDTLKSQLSQMEIRFETIMDLTARSLRGGSASDFDIDKDIASMAKVAEDIQNNAKKEEEE